MFGLSTGTNALEMVQVEKELPSFACTAKQMCEIVALSWQKQPNAPFYNVYKDDKLVAELSEMQTTWIDEEPSDEFSTYRVDSLDAEMEVIGKSWEIEAGKRCQIIESNKLSMEFRLDDKNYKVDGKQKGVMDAAPEIKFGRMFLVIRYITEALGAEIGWDGKEKKVTISTKDGKVIELWIGKPNARIDGEGTMIDPENESVVPYVSAGRTLLPMRFVANLLGADGDDGVIWDAETKTVTLNFGEEKITDLDIWNLVVVSTEPDEWTIRAYDDVRNNFTVLLSEEYSSLSKTAKSGDLIQVAGNIKSDGYSFKIEPRWAKALEFDEDCVNYICKPQNARDGVVIFSTEDDESMTLQYSPVFEQLENSVDNEYWVSMTADKSGNVLATNPVVFEPESVECEKGERVFKVKGVNKEKGVIHLELDDGDDVIETSMFFGIGDSAYDEVETGDCKVVTCATNYLGNVFVTGLEDSECPVPFKLSLGAESLKLYPGAVTDIEFNILNKSEIQSNFDVTLMTKTEDDEPKEQENDSVDINAKKSKAVRFEYTAPDEVGEYQVGVEVKSGLITKTIWMKIECLEVDFNFEAYKPEATRFRVNEPFSVKFTVSQDFDCPMNFEPITNYKKDIFVVDSVFESFSVDAHDKKTVSIDLVWGEDAVFNKEYEFEFGVASGELEKKETIKFKALGFEKPSVKITKATLGQDLKVTLEGEVDWKGADNGELIVDWGDGDSSEIDEFPCTHYYGSEKTYTIKVTARVYKGIEDIASTSFKCYDLPDPPEIVDISGEMPGEYTIRLFFKINWNGNKKGKLHIDWGDGKTEETTKTTVTHKYPRVDGMLYILTFKVVSDDGIESEEKMWMIMVFKNEISYIKIN